MWVFSINIFPDCYSGMLRGVIKALGIQKQTVCINLSGHWGISVTLQLFLGFYLRMGLEGMWIAVVINIFFIVSAYYVLIMKTDWEQKAKEGAERQIAKLEADTQDSSNIEL